MTSTEYQQLVELLGRKFAEIDRRFDEPDLRFTELRQEVLGHFDAIYHRFERLEQEYHASTQALRRIEAGLADERGRREILERALAELKQHRAALQFRIEEIEQRFGRQSVRSLQPLFAARAVPRLRSRSGPVILARSAA